MADGGLGTAPRKISEAPPSPSGVNPSNLQPTDSNRVKCVATQSDSSLAVNSATRKVRSTSRRFFLSAALSLMEAAFFSSSTLTLAAVCGMVAVTFATLGALSERLNRTAVLVGVILYVAQTVQLLIHGWHTAMIMVVYAVFVHSAIIYRLYLAYEMVGGLETAEI